MNQIKVLSLAALMLALCLSAAEEPLPEISLFDGKTLSGWKPMTPADQKYWSVIDGVITASNGDKKVPKNTWLISEKSFGDFEFRCKFRISGDHETGLINSGIQYRSLVKKKRMTGYQADIGRAWWGGIYDEHRRGKLVTGDISKLEAVLKEDGWNDYLIRCKGNHHELFINGVKTADYVEKKQEIPSKGVFGFQLHKGGVAKVEFKDIVLRPL